jgi:chitodextrinase
VAFAVDCPAPLPTTGDLTVTTTTVGTGSDPDGYTATVDGVTKQIAMNGSVTYNALTAGDHTVGLTGAASNCQVSAPNPRTVSVPAGGMPQTNFAITCTAPANQPPTAAFSSPSSNQLTCSFTSTSSDPDGTITTQQWDFGDGGTGSGGSPSHTYGADGTYTVKLTVTDNLGAQDVVTHDVTVSSPPPPTQRPVVNAGGDQRVLLSLLNVSLSASFTDPDNDGPWSYTIDWGDGSGSTSGATPSQGPITASHRYPTGLLATYTLRVTVTDSHGNFGTSTAQISVVLVL